MAAGNSRMGCSPFDVRPALFVVADLHRAILEELLVFDWQRSSSSFHVQKPILGEDMAYSSEKEPAGVAGSFSYSWNGAYADKEESVE